MSYEYTMPDGSTIKVVPESDLMAVKTGAEGREKDLTSQITEVKSLVETANKAREETHTQLLQAQAAKEQLEEQVKESSGHQSRAEGLQTELEASKATVSGLNDKLLDLKRVSIAAMYGVSADTIKDKTEEQLTNLEEALKLVAVKKPANLDIGGGGSASPVHLTGIEACKQEIAELRKK